MDDGFLKVLRLSADQPPMPQAMQQLRDGHLDVIQLDNVLSGDLCARLVAALEDNRANFEVTDFPGPFRSFFYGRNLNLNDPDLTAYFASARQFDKALTGLYDLLGTNLIERISGCLAALDNSQPFEAAPGPEGQTHFFTTFRGHRQGGYIPAHFDNEQAFRPSYRHVEAAATGDILSFVLTLAEAESGGMLELYDLLAEDMAAGFGNDDRLHAKPDLASLRSQCLPVPAGSMVIVQSGKRLHRVSPVEGGRTRWTMCSFMASARSGDRTLCWG